MVRSTASTNWSVAGMRDLADNRMAGAAAMLAVGRVSRSLAYMLQRDFSKSIAWVTPASHVGSSSHVSAPHMSTTSTGSCR